MNSGRLVVRRVDGWAITTENGVLVARRADGHGFVSFNDDGSGLYVDDVDEIPFLVINALREEGDKL